MTEKEIEKSFVNTYIIKNRRERIIFELSNPKKRQDALSRFCHAALKYLQESMIIYQGNKISYGELLSMIREHTKEKQCYVLAYGEDLDQKFMENQNAINQVMGNGMAAIMIWDNIVIVETEQEQGSAMKYVLCKNE